MYFRFLSFDLYCLQFGFTEGRVRSLFFLPVHSLGAINAPVFVGFFFFGPRYPAVNEIMLPICVHCSHCWCLCKSPELS